MAAKDWSHLRLPEDKLKTLETMLDASRKDHQRTMDALDEYADLAVSDLFDFDHPDKSLALTDPDAIVEAARNIVQVAQEAADNRYGAQRQAWQQAAGREFPEYALPDREDWTRVMWDVQKGFSNTDYNGLTYGQVMAGKARSGVTIMDLLPKTAGMGIDDMQQAYADFFRSLAAHAAQRRQMADIAGDPTKPRWARVPRGRVTCAFCTMLAGRGFVYTSEDAAGGGLGHTYHNHCDCEPVPTWGEAKLSGYDPDKLNAIYLQAKAGLPAGASYRDALSRMREAGGVADSLVGSPDRVYEPEEGKTSERKVGVMSDGIPGYLTRMVDEYRELMGRMERLSDYRTLHYRELCKSGEEDLMSDQADAIREYADVLMKRLRFHLGDRAAELVADGHRES